jgi:thioredoxin 1
MAKIGKVAIVVVLAAAVVTVIATKKAATSASSPPGKVPAAGGLPRLVDLGSTTCIPCKMLAPILEELGKECAGRLQVDFIDVNQNPDAAKPFGIKLIPTQVFLDASGKELWRHEGFISKEDILAKWKELGVDLPASPATSQPASTSIPAKSGST